MNSLFQDLNPRQISPQQQRNSNIKQLINSFKNSSNQQEFLNNLIKSNPNMQNIYSLIQNSNKSPKELFYLLAQQKNIDPNYILNMLN